MARKSVKRQAPTAKYPSPREYRWRAGPYRPPAVKVGDTLHDEYLGDVTVAGMTDAPISWPGHAYSRGRHSGLLPVLTGDLVRAVCEEQELVVAHYWGVTLHMVNQWKCALAGSTNSDQVAFRLALKRQDPQFRKEYGYT